MTRSRASALAALILLAACRKEERPKVRTEPWPAPGLSVSPSTLQGEKARFVLASGRVRLELKVGRTRVEGATAKLDGELDLDMAHVASTRGWVRADLLDLNFWPAGAPESPDSTLTLRALDALELGADRPHEDRERDRWAELRVVGFEATTAQKAFVDGFERGTREVRGSAELTLHRFRVPVGLELDVEPVSGVGDRAPTIRVRTRRPLVVSLAAHDIVVQRARASETAGRPAESEKDRAREARVSAELLFRLARPAPVVPPNP